MIHVYVHVTCFPDGNPEKVLKTYEISYMPPYHDCFYISNAANCLNSM